MKQALPVALIMAVGVLASALAIVWWRGSDRAVPLARRIPLPFEGTAAAAPQGTPEAPVKIGEFFARGAGIPSSLTGTWPCFRGIMRDNVAAGGAIPAGWSDEGPKCLWSVELGEGYAGPAVRNGCVYLLDYDGKAGEDVLRCLSLDDGREIWRRGYKVHIKRNHGISRTVPAVSERYVVTIGPRCHVMCVEAVTGAYKWGIDLEREWGAEVPMWYTGQCPLLDGTVAVIGVGGKALVIGVDCETGRILWQTPNPRNWKMSHASVVPMEVAGRKQYIYAAVGGIVGISAAPETVGALEWETDQWNYQVVAPSPVPLGNGRFWITSGYGAGSGLFEVTRREPGFAVALVQRLDKTVFACEQHTPVFYRDHLYTVLPADAGVTRKQAVCMDAAGRVVWTSGGGDRFGLGPFMVVDGKLLILEDNGTLTMAQATPDRYTRLARAKVLGGKEAWAPMAFADGRLLVRDYGMMRCLDLGKGSAR